MAVSAPFLSGGDHTDFLLLSAYRARANFIEFCKDRLVPARLQIVAAGARLIASHSAMARRCVLQSLWCSLSGSPRSSIRSNETCQNHGIANQISPTIVCAGLTLWPEMSC